jgi:tetratricopeptide (TPR) repeat protein
MVLKTCLLFLLLLSATSYAKRGSKQYFKQAQKQFKSKNYSKSITLLKKGYNFKRPKQMPASVLFLTGSNYQKLGQYDRSNYFYNQLIKNVYGKKHKKVMNAFKKNQVDDLELPSTLGATYINLGKNYFALFRKKGNHQSAKKAKMYIKICDEVDIADECSDLLEKINYSITKNQLNKTRKMFYLQIGRLLFQDRIEVKLSF